MQATALVESWKQTAGNWFNIGGLIGTLLTVPASKFLGRRTMFAIYFLASGLAVLAAFGLPMEPRTRLFMYFPIGLSVFGVFGAFTYYLPELYPTRLRGTGAGFCYNAGRLIAAPGPFLVGAIASRGAGALGGAVEVLVLCRVRAAARAARDAVGDGNQGEGARRLTARTYLKIYRSRIFRSIVHVVQ